MELEVVFFFGPPYAGKTLFYKQHFQATHQRVCPSDVFDSEPNITLRYLILKVVAILQKGQSVVIDDENELKHTRASYINLIKTKVPDCKFLCIKFKVISRNGRLQCNWAREWDVARTFLSNGRRSVDLLQEKEHKLCHWFEEQRIDIPDDSEGFEVSTVEVGLLCDSPYKFEVPAFIIQLEVLSPENKSTEPLCVEKIAAVINTWASANDTGRVIFLGNVQHSCSQENVIDEESWSDECCSWFYQIRNMLKQLASKVDTPLYFALIDYSFLKYSFIMPPQPGLIAWLQRLHNIDLTHKSSLYICTADLNTKMAQSAGIKTFKAKTVLSNPKMVNAVSCRTINPIPVCLSESKVCYYGNSGPGTRPPPHIPLLDKARASCGQTEEYHIVKEFAVGRGHGLCFKNLEVLEKYQEVYKKAAIPTKQVLYSPYNPDSVNSGMSSKNYVNSTEAKSACLADDLTIGNFDPKEEREKPTKSDIVQSSTVPCIKNLKVEDIQQHALSESRYKKGQTLVHLVKGFTVMPDTEGVQICCICTGSQGQNYDVSAIIGNESIIQAKCSCQDTASQHGQCKHVVAMLLNYIDPPSTETKNYVANMSCHGTWFLLPANPKDEHLSGDMGGLHYYDVVLSQVQNFGARGQWIECRVQSLESVYVTHRDPNPSDIFKQTKNKEEKQLNKYKKKRYRSKKSSSGVKDTVYVMSSQELLETAKQVLQEHHQSIKNKAEEENTTLPDESRRDEKISISAIDNIPPVSRQKHSNKEGSVEYKNQTSVKEQCKPLIGQELIGSSLAHHLKHDSNDILPEIVQSDDSLPDEDSKRRRKDYGKSILDELI